MTTVCGIASSIEVVYVKRPFLLVYPGVSGILPTGRVGVLGKCNLSKNIVM